MPIPQTAMRQVLTQLEPHLVRGLQQRLGKTSLGPIINSLLAAGLLLELPSMLKWVWTTCFSQRQKRQEIALTHRLDHMAHSVTKTQTQLSEMTGRLEQLERRVLDKPDAAPGVVKSTIRPLSGQSGLRV